MDYWALGLAGLQQLGGALVGCAICTLVGAPIMKLTERGIPFWRHALICFWAFVRGVALYDVAIDVWVRLLRQPLPSWADGLALIVTLCGIGWLISADLKKQGVNRRFPGVGARVIFWLNVVVVVVVVIGLFAGLNTT
jgi:hypothetical protein